MKLKYLFVILTGLILASASPLYSDEQTPPQEESQTSADSQTSEASQESSSSEQSQVQQNNQTSAGEDTASGQGGGSQFLTGSLPAGIVGVSASQVQVEPSTGSATLSIPLEVPPGRGGIQPNLALMYNSSLRNGVFGVGWSLELGAIQRSTKNGPPTYNDATDKFVLMQNGSTQELVYDIATQRYMPEIEGAFMKIQKFGNTQWVITDRKGTQYYFGFIDAAMEYRGSGASAGYPEVFKWNLWRVIDIHGNDMEITYIRDGDKNYPIRIDYSRNSDQSIAFHASVDFVLEDRPDAEFNYNAGYLRKTSKRVKEITMSVGTALQRRYAFNYSISSSSQRSILTSINQFGSDNISQLPTIILSYQNQKGFQLTGGWTIPSGSAFAQDWSGMDMDRGVRVFDVNSDNYPDLVRNWSNWAGTLTQEVYKHNGTNGWVLESGGWNLNGVEPVIQFIASTLQEKDKSTRYVDVNADGWTDAVSYIHYYYNNYGSPNQKACLNNHTNGFVDTPSWHMPIGTTSSTSPHIVYEHSWGNQFMGTVFADVNADGYVDFIRSKNADASFPTTRLSYLNKIPQAGTGWQYTPGWNLPAGANETYTDLANGAVLLDLNGDGLPEIFYRKAGVSKVFMNTGAGWVYDFNVGGGWEALPTIGDLTNGRTDFGDINGDGLVDLLVVSLDYASGSRVLINTGSGWYQDDAWVISGPSFANKATRILDANSDGMMDYLAHYLGNTPQLYLNTGKPADLLWKVTNGVGGETTIAYESSAYSPNTQYPTQIMPFIVPVVKTVTVKDTLSNETYATQYSYKDGVWNTTKREFRGFRVVKVTDPIGSYTETTFLQDDIYKGRIATQASYDSGGNVFALTGNTWASQQIIPGVNFVFLQRSDNYVFDGDVTGRRSAQLFFYDETPQFGNLTKTIQLGEVDLATGADIGTDSRTVETDYVGNTTSWILGLPREVRVKNHNLTEMRKSWFWYDNNVSLTALPIKGLLTKKEDWNNYLQGNANNPKTQYSYDATGNLLSTTDPRNFTTTIAYDTATKIFPLTTTNALNQTVTNTYYGVNGVALDDGAGYKGLWGQLKSTTDPNNQLGRKSYDVFGRVTKTVSPLDSISYPTTTVEYTLNPTYIKIITRSRIEHGQASTLDSVQFTDGVGRVIQTKTTSETSGQYVVSGQTQYNSRGLPEKKYINFFSTNAFDAIDPISTSNPYTLITYDAVSRVVQTTNPDGSYANVVYDDWTTTTIDENGHKQKSYFDAYGRLIKKEEFLGADGRGAPQYPSSPYTLYATTLYAYDSEGNLTQTIDAHNNTTAITYDKLGRKTSMTDPDMGTWNYTYDLNGNLTSQTDAKAQQITFAYDALNRLSTKNFPQGPELPVTYTYDDVLVSFSKGRLTKAQYVGTQNTQFNYDQLGRETQSTKSIDSVNYQVQRTYDALNRLKELEYPNGKRLYYKYNAAGQIEAVADDPALLPGGGASLKKEIKDSDIILVKNFKFQMLNFKWKDLRNSVQSIARSFQRHAATAVAWVTQKSIDLNSPDVMQMAKAWLKRANRWWHENVIVWIRMNVFGIPNAFAGGLNFTVNLEAENMPTKTTGGATTYGWNIWSNGYIEQSVNFPETGEYKFEIIAKGSFGGGAWPNMQLRINQVSVANWTVSSSSWKPYIVKINVAGGAQNVAIAFTNDYNGGPSDDRNLYVDKTIISKPALGAYQQPNDAAGIVSMEAENNDSTYAVNGKSWDTISQTGQSGSGSMQALPNSGTNNSSNYINISTRADFNINFTKTGTHYIWARGKGATTNDDSYHAGLDSNSVSSAANISSFGTGWTWSKTVSGGGSATVNVTSTGEHTLNIWMREDGFIIDKIVVTTSSSYTPTGTGPLETPRQGNNTPAAPTLNAPTAGDGQVSLNWTSVTNADGYKVKYGTSSGNYPTILDVGNVTSYTVTNLTNNTTYYFVVVAYNANGDSPNSNERSATPQPTIPSAPVLNLPTPGDGQVSLSWNTVSGATSYKIYYGTTSGGGGGGTNFTQDPDCVGAWKLDETTGAYIDSCLANDGTVSGTVTRGVAGQFDEAIEFLGYPAGNNAYVNFGSHSSLDNLAARTIVAWIKPHTLGDASKGTILNKDYQDGWVFRVSASNKLAFSQAFSGGVVTWTTTNSVLTMNTFQHVAVTYTAAGTSAVPTIYVNGVPQPVTGSTPFGTRDNDAAFNLQMGILSDVQEFDGVIDEAAVFKRILTETEINAIRTDGLTGGAGSGYPNSVNVGNVTSHTVTGLTNNTTYYFAVTASNSAGQSPYSNEQAATPTPPAAGTLFIANVNYNAHGQITRIDYGNGVVTVYSYHPQNLRLTQILTVNPVGEILQNLNYTYDKLGNIINIDDLVNTADQTFQYDALNRLITANGNYCSGSPCLKTFVYDTIGNIMQKDGLNYTYPQNGVRPHAVTALSDGTTFTYDANGNMTTKVKAGVTTTYTYDKENRLLSVANGAATVAQFAYDGDGGRTKKVLPSSVIRYVGSLYEDKGTTQINYIFLGGTRIASITGSSVLYYHADHLGGTNVLTNSTGVKKELIEYMPFGEYARHEMYGSSSEVAWFYFTGKPLDDETGLYYYGARYYDPSIGRFITPDLLVQAPGNPQTFNRYTYANNNPVNLVDPSGHGWFKKFWKKVTNFFEDFGNFVSPLGRAVVTGDWKSFGTIVGSAVAAVASFGALAAFTPMVMTANTAAVIGLSAMATTATLDTLPGRQVINFVSNEIFDDAFGMSPRNARIAGSLFTHMAVNAGFQSYFASKLAPGGKLTSKEYEYGRDKALDVEVSKMLEKGQGEGFNFGSSPWKPEEVSRILLNSSGELVGATNKANILMLGAQHTGIVMKDIPSLAGRVTLKHFPNMSHQYGLWGISHQAVNVSLLEAGYSSTVMSVGGGWTTGMSTVVYGPYGGGAVGATMASQELRK